MKKQPRKRKQKSTTNVKQSKTSERERERKEKEETEKRDTLMKGTNERETSEWKWCSEKQSQKDKIDMSMLQGMPLIVKQVEKNEQQQEEEQENVSASTDEEKTSFGDVSCIIIAQLAFLCIFWILSLSSLFYRYPEKKTTLLMRYSSLCKHTYA